MKATMLLADAAQVAEGKLYIIGGGWSVTGPGASPSAVAVKLEVPWDQSNRQHEFKLALMHDDGTPVKAPTPSGDESVEFGGRFEVGRPAGLKPGTPIDLPLAFNLGPIPLDPGQGFVWQLWIDGYHDEDWRLAFSTRQAEAAS